MIPALFRALLHRLTTMIGRSVAAGFEVAILGDYADRLAEVEAHARRLEEAGFPEQAEALRKKAHQITPADPGAVEPLKLSIGQKPDPSRNGQAPRGEDEPPAEPPRPRRGRPPKRITTVEPGPEVD